MLLQVGRNMLTPVPSFVYSAVTFKLSLCFRSLHRQGLLLKENCGCTGQDVALGTHIKCTYIHWLLLFNKRMGSILKYIPRPNSISQRLYILARKIPMLGNIFFYHFSLAQNCGHACRWPLIYIQQLFGGKRSWWNIKRDLFSCQQHQS
jgi:hypothetical protein